MTSAPGNESELDEYLSRPDDATTAALAAIDGDVLILGAGGKMGPTLARMARRALTEAGVLHRSRRVIAVSRFSNTDVREKLEHEGVEVVCADLANPAAFKSLVQAANVIWMVGQKFGTTGDPVGTWTQNVAAAVFGAEHCTNSRVVCFSSGNVYGRGPVAAGGSLENDALVPDGEYSASCIGRERVFESAARRLNYPLLLYRLFYACDLRYGVLTDIALRVLHGETISLATPAVNVIWQGDANRLALRALSVANAPAVALNVTGDVVAVREIAERIGRHMNREVQFNVPAAASTPDVLLANTTQVNTLLPHAPLDLDTLCGWTAEWVAAGRHLLSKPTKFDVRDGKY